MGVLRYLPGWEPDRDVEGRAVGPEAEAVEPSGRIVGDSAGDASRAEWAVPGIAPSRSTDIADEPLRGRTVSDRTVSDRTVSDRPVSFVPASVPSTRVEHISLGALSRHDVSEAEMLDKLRSRGFDGAEASDEVERLKRVGLLDDTALAERLVRSLRERKGLGDAAIGPALRLRRIPTAIIDAALADSDEEASLDRLEALARERARRLGSLEPAVAERRLTAYLVRKGYPGTAVRSAVRRALTAQSLD